MLYVPSFYFVLLITRCWCSEGEQARHQGGVVEHAAVAADLAWGHHRLLCRSQPLNIHCGLLSTLCPDSEPADTSPTWPIIVGAVFGAVAVIGILIVIFLKIRRIEMSLHQENLFNENFQVFTICSRVLRDSEEYDDGEDEE